MADQIQSESIQGMQDFLADENDSEDTDGEETKIAEEIDEETEEEKVERERVEEEDAEEIARLKEVENNKTDEEKAEEAELAETQIAEDDEALKSIGFKEVRQKYPNLFKDFPELRHTFFHAKEYRELFPTVEDAKEAVEGLEELKGFQELETALSKGDEENTLKVVKSFKDMGDGVIENFSSNFLSALKKVDRDTYFEVISPELINFVRTLYINGVKNENENHQNAARVAAHHFFGDQKVATGEVAVESQRSKKETENPKDDELKKDRENFHRERYTTLYNDVIQESNSQLLAVITDGLDSRSAMSDEMQSLIAEKVVKTINDTLHTNKAHSKQMENLWKKAQSENFAGSWKSKIVTAYINDAKEIMPKIRSTIRSKVLGTRVRRSEKQGVNTDKRREGRSGTGGGERSRSSDKTNINKINWKKTSDLDFLKDDVTLIES